MGEQTLSQTHDTAQSFSSLPPTTTTAIVAAAPSPSASAIPAAAVVDPASSSAVTSTVNSTNSGKIPFRPRKIRKVASSATHPAALDEGLKKEGLDTGTVASNNSRLAVRIIPRSLSADGEIAAALRHLRAADPQLAHVIDAHEPPVFERVHPPFHSLARSILYQQLAFKAAASIYGHFLALCGGEAAVVPETVLALTPHQLRQIGVSARKASYLHDLARKYHGGILSDASIVAMDDKSLFSMLTMVKGIGAWSVHMFMIFSLHRPDVLPVGDLGVRKGVQMLYGLEEVPRPSQMEQLCERWRPYRSVGSWYMWRVTEAKGNPGLPSSATAREGAGGIAMDAIAGVATVQQPLMIDPIQMLPNLG